MFFWHLRPLAARRLRRLATVLACLTLGAGVGRCVIGLHSIEVEPDTFLTTVPQPVVDDPMLVGAAANSLVKTTRRLDRDLAIDGASSALTLACVTALTLFGVALARAGREAEAPPEPRNA